jgi:long-chain fatty acid transport protein
MWWLVSAAWAGGYFYSDSGIVATGRGGAFVASAEGQFAQYYNPAGLLRTERPTFNLGLSGVQQKVTFERQRADGTPYPAVENQAPPFLIPEIGFVSPVGDRFAVAVGFYSPFAPSSEYPEEGPQRYSIKETLIYQFSIGPSFAWQVHDTLRVGVGLQWQYLQVGETVDITINGSDEQSGDIAISARAVDPFTPNANAGLVFTPVAPLSIGLSVQPPTKFSARGTGSLDFTDNALEGLLNASVYTDDDVALNIDIPWVVRAGVAVRPIERLEIELATVWQDWSSLQDIVVEDVDVTVDSDLIPEEDRVVSDRFELPAGFRDTVSVRLGGEWRVHERVAVRAGGFWENAAVAPDELSVALVDTPKVQVGGGGSVFGWDDRVRFDAAFAWLAFRSASIRDSTVRQIDAGVLDSSDPQVVGNGDLSSHGWVLGAAASVGFGKRRHAE